VTAETDWRGVPSVLRMILGRQLEELRVRAGLTYDRAGVAIGVSHFTICRMEAAKVARLRLADAEKLLQIYGVTGQQETAAFPQSVREANKRGWCHTYRDVMPDWFAAYLSLEQAALQIRAYEWAHWSPAYSSPSRRHGSCPWSAPGRPVPSRPGHVDTARGDGKTSNHHSGRPRAPLAGAASGVPDRLITVARTAVLTLSQGLLASAPEGRTAYIEADFRDPAAILDAPELRETLDLVGPGVVQVHKWHPDGTGEQGIRDEDIAMYGAVARKP
jgi:hypothetical protein